MDRRDFIKTSTVAAVAFAATQRGFAATKESKAEGAAPANADKLKAVNKAALDCFAASQACVAHCEEQLEKGNTKMSKCLADTLNMGAIVETTIKLTGGRAVDPESLKQALAACSNFCKICAESCKPHISHSAACKDCKDACDRCADACDAYIKA